MTNLFITTYRKIYIDGQGIVRSDTYQSKLATRMTREETLANFRAADLKITSMPLQETISVEIG